MNAKNDFKVADMSLAEWGRKEIAIAETENAWFNGFARRVQRTPAAQGARVLSAAFT